MVLRLVTDRIRFLQPKQEVAKSELMKEIEETKFALQNAQNRFESVVDDDLIDSCIYETRALESQYQYLLKKARQE